MKCQVCNENEARICPHCQYKRIEKEMDWWAKILDGVIKK